MLDVLELEKKWSKYHFRKSIPKYLTLGLVGILLSIPTYIYITTPEVFSALLTPNTTAIKKTQIVSSKKVPSAIHPVHNTQLVEPQVNWEQNILVPSFFFTVILDSQITAIENQTRIAAVAVAKAKMKKAALKAKAKAKKVRAKTKTKTKTKTKIVPKKVIKPVVKPTDSIPKTRKKKVTVLGDKSTVKQISKKQQGALQVGHNSTSKSQLDSVIKRFKKSRKPALGLFISNKFYEQGNYQESYNYARQTYKINPKLEGAVMLYAKSLAKLGKKDKAISKLKPYIRKTGSIKAKTLLNQIKKGTL